MNQFTVITTQPSIWERMKEAVALVHNPRGVELGKDTMTAFVQELAKAFPEEQFTHESAFTFMTLPVSLNPEAHDDSIHVLGAVYN